MGSEDLPLPHAEALHYCPAFLCAELRIGVHGRHQNRRVLIIGRLFARHAVGIHVYIASERYMVGEIDQHRLALQMTAGTLIYLEAQISEAEKPDGIPAEAEYVTRYDYDNGVITLVHRET